MMTGGPQGAGNRGRVVTVFGAKGGIGKSMIATNMATVLAEECGKSVLLIDLDTRFGSFAVLLGIEPTSSIADVVRGAGPIDDAAFDRAVVTHTSGVHILPAPRDPREWKAIDGSAVKAIVDHAAGVFDYVILDAPGTYNDIVEASLMVADKVLAVSSRGIASLKDTAHFFDVLDAKRRVWDRVSLTINDVHPADDVGESEIRQATGHEVFWRIPYESALATAKQEGQPLVRSRPQADAAQALRAMTLAITGEEPRMSPPASRWSRARRRLFRG
jgi:pilus assembly protein CpaE